MTDGIPDLENLRRQYEAVLNNPYFSHAEKDMARHVLALCGYIERLQEAAGVLVAILPVWTADSDARVIFLLQDGGQVTLGDFRALAALLPERRE